MHHNQSTIWLPAKYPTSNLQPTPGWHKWKIAGNNKVISGSILFKTDYFKLLGFDVVIIDFTTYFILSQLPLY